MFLYLTDFRKQPGIRYDRPRRGACCHRRSHRPRGCRGCRGGMLRILLPPIPSMPCLPFFRSPLTCPLWLFSEWRLKVLCCRLGRRRSGSCFSSRPIFRILSQPGWLPFTPEIGIHSALLLECPSHARSSLVSTKFIRGARPGVVDAMPPEANRPRGAAFR